MVDPKLLHAVGKKLIAYSGVEETSASLDERVDNFITKNKLAIISKSTSLLKKTKMVHDVTVFHAHFSKCTYACHILISNPS